MQSFFSYYLKESDTQDTYYAVVPGSFKPPHKGHYAMIKHYSDMVGTDGKVFVYISKPSPRSERTTALGKPISAEIAREILALYCANLPNVSIKVSEISPVKDAYDFGKNINSGTVIFGCSKKGDDIKRWNNVKSYYQKNYPNVYVVDPVTTAVDATSSEVGAVSASDFRNAFGDKEKMKQFLPDHLSEQQKNWVVSKLLL